jgi:predicted nucleic acid-binding protein
VSAPVAYLLDSGVLLETRKKKADPGVMAFLQATDSSALYLSVLTIGELRKGIAIKRRTDLAAARALAGWVEGLEFGFADRILPIDAATARLWGDWSGDRPRPVIDTLLAATAAKHALTFVTRNTRDVSGLPVRVHNPWTT